VSLLPAGLIFSAATCRSKAARSVRKWRWQPGAHSQGQRPSPTSPTSSPSATLTCSGTAGWLVSALLFWYFFPTAVPFFEVSLVDHPSGYPTAGIRRGTAA
jgi:hypothetical protein